MQRILGTFIAGAWVLFATANLTLNPVNNENGILLLKQGLVLKQIDTFSLACVYNITYLHEVTIKILALYVSTKEAEDRSLLGSKDIRYQTYKNQIEASLSLINKKIMFIAPHSTRVRRGIINGLGSVVKAITGNLDYEDAIKFENEISNLRNSIYKIQNSQKQSLFLAENTIKEFSKQIQIIKENEEKLVNLLKNATISNNLVINHMNFLDLYIQINFSLEFLLNKLLVLEDAMTFAQIGIMHPSIIAPHNLITEIQNMQKSNRFKAVDSISIKNIHSIEKSISVKAYSTEHALTFILEIPSVDPNVFDLLHIYSIPDKQNLTIIPKSKYLVLGSEEYSYLEDSCKKITQDTHLCATLNTQPVDKSEDCVISLIKHQKANCTRAKMNLKQQKIQKIEENKWLIILQHDEILRIHCGSKTTYKRISGIQIVSITSDCQLEISNKILRTNSDTITIDEIIPLPSTPITPEEKIHYNLQLEDISLDSIHELMERAEDIPNEDGINWQVMMATPSWPTIGIYIICAGIICWKVYLWRQSRSKTYKTAEPAVRQNSCSEDATGSCKMRFQLKEGGVTRPIDATGSSYNNGC
ncbi:uncharacterized protein LOC123653692 [Melitaea cinxia]|uniref:uncharacterized protein LOC123653692 n=1 Tax=Melitaea cinxia TaxID=113334 RepID=UPI001E26FCAB|nr:uncharacterized protein LOC123653692 [Melitaea cinxia]